MCLLMKNKPGYALICKLIRPMVLMCLFALNARAQKNDTVYMINGDRITGEIKRYQNGLLVLKTDGISTINIEYDKIRTLYSRKQFDIVKKTGFSYFGTITKSAIDRNIGICITNDTVTEPIFDIVEITRIKNRFWNKFSGSVDLGLSYFKSTNTLQYFFNGTLNYRARKDLVSANMNIQISDQKVSDSAIKTNKNDVGLNYSHFFQGRWWGGIGTKWQENTELDLDYRLQAGIGAGYDFVHTNPVRFYAMGGFLVNREKPTDSISFSTNLEGLVSLKLTWIQFRHPEIDISSNFNAYPSLTVKDRYRLEYNLEIKFEIFKDFYLGLTFYDDYDSKPSGGGPALNDWSIIGSVGYSF
jgi:hypothetical protein